MPRQAPMFSSTVAAPKADTLSSLAHNTRSEREGTRSQERRTSAALSAAMRAAQFWKKLFITSSTN